MYILEKAGQCCKGSRTLGTSAKKAKATSYLPREPFQTVALGMPIQAPGHKAVLASLVGICTGERGRHKHSVSFQEGLRLFTQDSRVPWKLSPTAPQDNSQFPYLRY